MAAFLSICYTWHLLSFLNQNYFSTLFYYAFCRAIPKSYIYKLLDDAEYIEWIEILIIILRTFSVSLFDICMSIWYDSLNCIYFVKGIPPQNASHVQNKWIAEDFLEIYPLLLEFSCKKQVISLSLPCKIR